MNILVAGAGSYIGESFRNYIKKWPERYNVTCLDMVGDSWKNHKFTNYDVVYQVAGIAHIKETEDNKNLYYTVNRDLALEVAKKAREEGVKQFIYLSSMSAYGLDEGVITRETKLNPISHYAKSKVQAEKLLKQLETDSFRVAILRPPMVYGRGCKGNFNELEKLALTLPIFPKVNNIRSMLYIDNLSEFVRIIIDEGKSGLFFPQNREYVCTYDMVSLIRSNNGKKLIPSYILGFCVAMLAQFNQKAKKAFGSLVYKETEDFDFSYCKYDLPESMNLIYEEIK